MHRSRRISLALVAALLLILAVTATALAAPITVNLRVEGSSTTLFEGPVSTEVPPPPGITTASSEGAHLCDFKDNGTHEGFGASGATPTSALVDAATANGLTFDAKWAKSLNDFFVTQVGGDIEGGAPEFPAWGYAVNYTTAEVGGCQFLLAPGSEVLWAYNYFNLHHLLKLSAPAVANGGTPFTVHVTDGQTGEPLAGATVGQFAGGVTTALSPAAVTDSSGNTAVTLPNAGTVTLKATRPESVRSNGVTICLHNGNDGSCGTAATPAGEPKALPTPPHPFEGDVAKITGVKNGAVYRRRAAPRILSGQVEIRAGGTLSRVQISLARRYRGRCFQFSGSRVRFLRARKCAAEHFFSVGSTQSFSYLLPAPLPPGRYVFEMRAVEGNGKRTKPVDGISRVAFRVK
ncbi:MAG: carboxypeptidase-like regulatory domain-containing protein [Actinobacteria bacterium]|nr:MAG: carboxypeptidase-like regulatory domain-containing protein [Actinomycetota bacterium]